VVFITEGMSLRIPVGGLVIPLDGSEMPPVKIEVVLDTWRYWLNIATGHVDNAVGAHAKLVAAHAANDDQAKGAALEEEFTSSIQGISASAFSLEAFYASVNERIPADEELAKRWAKNRTARTVRICEILIRAFMITHPGRKILRENLEQVFKFRDYAVHPPARFREPIMHPDLGVGVEWRFISFSALGAIASSRVAMSIIKQCLHAPRSEHEELAKWSQDIVAKIDEMTARWEKCHGPLL
jgi:hypothetical protein